MSNGQENNPYRESNLEKIIAYYGEEATKPLEENGKLSYAEIKAKEVEHDYELYENNYNGDGIATISYKDMLVRYPHMLYNQRYYMIYNILTNRSRATRDTRFASIYFYCKYQYRKYTKLHEILFGSDCSIFPSSVYSDIFGDEKPVSAYKLNYLTGASLDDNCIPLVPSKPKKISKKEVGTVYNLPRLTYHEDMAVLGYYVHLMITLLDKYNIDYRNMADIILLDIARYVNYNLLNKNKSVGTTKNLTRIKNTNQLSDACDRIGILFDAQLDKIEGYLRSYCEMCLDPHCEYSDQYIDSPDSASKKADLEYAADILYKAKYGECINLKKSI